MKLTDDPLDAPATDLLARLSSGALTARECGEALIARIAAWADLNAFVDFDPDRARAAAAESDRTRRRGTAARPLEGLPLVIKDNVDVAGWPTSAGTPALAAYRPARSARAVARLLDAGAWVLGKNTMHELAHGITCNNAFSGPVRNPYDRRHIPGGSSGGTAAAIAARLAPAGLGTDTGGSVRIPAALCGIVGFRPSTGRYPTDGVVPISHTRDTPGPLARRVADIALLDGVLAADPAPLVHRPLAGVRLGMPRALYHEGLDAEVAEHTLLAHRALEAAGAVLVEADVEGLDAISATVAGVLSDYEFPRDLAAYLQASGSGIGLEALIAALASPDLQATFAHEVRGPAAPSEATYRQALEVGRPAVQAAFRAHFARHGLAAIVFPTTAQPAPLVGQERVVMDGREVPVFVTFLRNARPATTAGLPGISLPIGRTRAGLPVGLELDGPAGSDRALLALAAAVEPLFAPLAPPAR